jgi:diacylglycerol kinase (ATP)
MKHIMIANPAAGPQNNVEKIRKEVAALDAKYDVEIYETKGRRDATEYIRRYLTEHPDEQVRFYACGGDGTLNEVVSGVYGFPHASVSCYPCGSGNDFVKYYGGADCFLSLPALFEGEEREIDILTDGENHSVNVANFGFDYFVCETMVKLRRKRFFGGKRAYYGGIVRAIFGAMKNRARVIVDGQQIGTDEMLLCTVSNGSYVGGSFHCAPHSSNEDGLLEICSVKPVSVFRFISLIGAYKKGKHLDDERFASILHYTRGKEVEVIAEDERFGYTLDGEMKKSMHFTFRILPKAIRFAVPRNAPSLLKKAERETASTV